MARAVAVPFAFWPGELGELILTRFPWFPMRFEAGELLEATWP